MKLKTCSECGKEISPETKICPHCGAQVVETSSINNLSKTWKKRFEIIEKANGNYLKTQNLKLLTPKERLINFNILAFIFGVIYYIVKGMWKKGLVLLGAFLILSIILNIISLIIPIFGQLFYIIPSVVCAGLANYDYYRYVVYGETMWNFVPSLEKNINVISFAVGSFIFAVIFSGLLLGGGNSIKRQFYGKWNAIKTNTPVESITFQKDGTVLMDAYNEIERGTWEIVEADPIIIKASPKDEQNSRKMYIEEIDKGTMKIRKLGIFAKEDY